MRNTDDFFAAERFLRLFVGNRSTYQVYPTAGYTSCVASGTANTFGSWVEIIAASAITVSFMVTHLLILADGTNAAHTIQIGTGTGGSEVIRGLLHGWLQGTSVRPPWNKLWLPPIYCRANERVALRVCSNGTDTATTQYRITAVNLPLRGIYP